MKEHGNTATGNFVQSLFTHFLLFQDNFKKALQLLGMSDGDTSKALSSTTEENSPDLISDTSEALSGMTDEISSELVSDELKTFSSTMEGNSSKLVLNACTTEENSPELVSDELKSFCNGELDEIVETDLGMAHGVTMSPSRRSNALLESIKRLGDL